MREIRKLRNTSSGDGTAFGRLWLIVLFAAVLAFSACTPNQRIIESSRTPEPVPPKATPVNTVESELEAMQNADFTYILVFRRRDAAVMDAADKSFINANLPPDINRKSLSEGGRAVVIGSNFPLLPGSIEKLTDRFVMEDHSKPEAGPLEEDRSGNKNAASNANKARNVNVNRVENRKAK